MKNYSKHYQAKIKGLQEENASLKAEVERLTVAADWKTPARKIQALEAENERLRKAGDELCEMPYLCENDPAVIAWRAATDGKPQS